MWISRKNRCSSVKPWGFHGKNNMGNKSNSLGMKWPMRELPRVSPQLLQGYSHEIPELLELTGIPVAIRPRDFRGVTIPS